MIEIDSASLRSLERSEARASRIQRGGAMNALFDVVDDQALDGLVVKFDKPFPYKGELILLKTGCFGDHNNRRVGFQIDHDVEVASTDDAVSVMIDDDGIQFRLDLAKCELGSVIARMCSIDNRASMSVGCDILNERREELDGKSVRVVTRAHLNEITLCKEGCAPDAFAMVVSKSVTPKPVAGSRTSTLRAGQRLHHVSRAVRKLKAQVITTYDDTKPVKVPRFSVEQTNRWQTEETERLQALARRSLSRWAV
jgi:hypothetical protein